MRIFLQYIGFIIILAVAVVLFLSFTADIDKATKNVVLLSSAIAVVVGIVLSIVGGKFADKIGGKSSK